MARQIFGCETEKKWRTYVVTHELVHLLERNHNEQFQKYMDTFFPAWRVVKETLNQQMLDYMSE